MRALVIGGTGVAGRLTVAALAARGHEVRALSRSGGPGRPGLAAPAGAAGAAGDGRPGAGVTTLAGDIRTGEGLRAALDGVDCVLDCANVRASRGEDPADFFVTSTRLIGRFAAAAGVRQHVVLSIVGIDAVPSRYYHAKLRQERAALDGPVPATVLRATQFHEFVGQMLRRGRRGPFAVVPSMLIQPIAAAEVAQALADVVESGQVGRAPDVGGPRAERLVDLVRRLLAFRRERVVVVPGLSPGKAGRARRGGALLLDERGVVRGPDFSRWLAQRAAPR